MNLSRLARSGLIIALGGLAVSSSLGTGLSLTGCGESGSCTKLRQDTSAAKQIWDACNPDEPEPCIKVSGNPKDCTGVLSCDFAVNPRHRAEAEQVVLTIAQQSQGCYQCAIPNCAGGDLPRCEPVSRRCIVGNAIGGGASSSGGGGPATEDSGGTHPVSGTPDAGPSDALSPDNG